MGSISQEVVNDTLTSSGRCSFAVGGVIYRWGPKTRLSAIKGLDDDLYYACMDYLKGQGRQFLSLVEAIAVAIRDKWPNWENLTQESEADTVQRIQACKSYREWLEVMKSLPSDDEGYDIVQALDENRRWSGEVALQPDGGSPP